MLQKFRRAVVFADEETAPYRYQRTTRARSVEYTNMKFGESLRKERELRGITLEEISQQSKVHSRFLQAIEQDDLSVLPAKAFAKGFLRSYARIVGLDEEMVISNFEYCHRHLEHGEQVEQEHYAMGTGTRHRFVFVTLFVIILALLTILLLYFQGYLTFNRL